MEFMNRTISSRYTEEVKGIIIGDIPPPQVSARLLSACTLELPNEERQIIYRQDGFANDAEGRQWAKQTVDSMNRDPRYREKYPKGLELQLHTY